MYQHLQKRELKPFCIYIQQAIVMNLKGVCLKYGKQSWRFIQLAVASLQSPLASQQSADHHQQLSTQTKN